MDQLIHLLGYPFVQNAIAAGIVIAIVRWRDGFGIVDDAILRERGLVVAFAAEGAVMAVAEVIVFVDGREEFQGPVCGKCDRDVPDNFAKSLHEAIHFRLVAGRLALLTCGDGGEAHLQVLQFG